MGKRKPWRSFNPGETPETYLFSPISLCYKSYLGVVASSFVPMSAPWVSTCQGSSLESAWVRVIWWNTSLLNQRISGIQKTRWKAIQVQGRLARQMGERGVFITLVPEKQPFRGLRNSTTHHVSPAQLIEASWIFRLCFWEGRIHDRQEALCVWWMSRKWPLWLFQGQRSSRWSIVPVQYIAPHHSLYQNFLFFSVCYGDLSVHEGCPKCYCCTQCTTQCAGSCGGKEGETFLEVVCRILSIDPNSEAIQSAEQHRRRFVVEAEEYHEGNGGPAEEGEGLYEGDDSDGEAGSESSDSGDDWLMRGGKWEASSANGLLQTSIEIGLKL